MIIAGYKERKRVKVRMLKKLKEHQITMRRIEELSGYHYNTVRSAFDVDSKYWNQKLIDLAEELTTLKKDSTN